eukprot:COSAG06_NODE_2354_length_7021_cov_10.485264_8_plen_55_part_00
MFPGIVESADGEWLYLYMWGTAATHHVQGHCPDKWGNKCALGGHHIRLHCPGVV